MSQSCASLTVAGPAPQAAPRLPGQTARFAEASWFPLALAAYLVVHFLLHCLAPALKSDDGEQLVLSQMLAGGYGVQPPLYTWLVWTACTALGVNVGALMLVRTLALGGIYLFAYLSARLVLDDRRLAVASAGTLLIAPVFAWDIVYGLTHTLLLCTMCAATLYAWIRLLRFGGNRDYLGLGVALGLGLLTKYNFEVFALALVGATFSVREARARLLNWRLALTVGAAAVVLAPHALWAIAHHDRIVASLAGRAGIDQAATVLGSRAAGLAHLTGNVLVTAAPLALVFGLFFGRPGLPALRDPVQQALGRYALALAVVLLIHVAAGVTKFHPRWLAPLLVPLPVVLFLGLPTPPGTARLRAWTMMLGAAALLVIVLRLALQFVLLIGREHARDVLDADAVAAVRAAGFHDGIVATDDYILAGRARLLLPDAAVLCTSWPFDPAPQRRGPVLLLWNALKGETPPPRLVELIGMSESTGPIQTCASLRFIILPTRR